MVEVQERVNLKNTVNVKERKKKPDIRNQICQQNFLSLILVVVISKSLSPVIWEIK